MAGAKASPSVNDAIPRLAGPRLAGSRLAGHVAVVTGGSSGIGQYAARGLARQGASVVITGRNAGRLAAAAAWLKTEAPGATIETEQVDFAVLADIRALAERVRLRHAQIAVLINNAGMLAPTRKVTRDGLETLFQVNHLGCFLLTNLLLPAITAGAPARIVTTSSLAARRARIDFNDLQLARGWSLARAYGRSKLMNILFTYALARRLAGSGVTATSVHPGFVASRLGRMGGLYDLGWTLAKPFAISPEKGGETLIHAATAPELEGRSGLYLVRKTPVRSNDMSYDIEAGERLWRISAELTGIAP